MGGVVLLLDGRVDCCHEQVLEGFHIVLVHGVGIDLDHRDDPLTVHGDLHHSAAGFGFETLCLEVALGLHHLALHLLKVAQHFAHVHNEILMVVY